MKRIFVLTSVLLVATGCDNTPVATEAGEAPAVTQQKQVAQQKLTIEQAAEEATKLIEADAKAEIDAAKAVETAPAQ